MIKFKIITFVKKVGPKVILYAKKFIEIIFFEGIPFIFSYFKNKIVRGIAERMIITAPIR